MAREGSYPPNLTATCILETGVAQIKGVRAAPDYPGRIAMKRFLGVFVVTAGLLAPLSLVAQNQRDDDRGRNQGYGGSQNQGQGRLSAEDQSRFDSYYTRWLDYGQRNDRDNQNSMEGRMREVMARYNIPSDVSFDQIASNGSPGYRVEGRRDGDGDNHGQYRHEDRRNQWQNRLSAKDQRRFDSYYTRWLDARQNRDRRQRASMEQRMRDLMGRYSIPADAQFAQIASVSAGRY
jgi:hypothetical protein